MMYMLRDLLSVFMSATHEQCMCTYCSEEDSGTEQPSKAIGRRKTKIDHITVEYLRDHHCFDMPLAVRQPRIICTCRHCLCITSAVLRRK